MGGNAVKNGPLVLSSVAASQTYDRLQAKTRATLSQEPCPHSPAPSRLMGLPGKLAPCLTNQRALSKAAKKVGQIA